MAPLPSTKPAPILPERDGHRLAELARETLAGALGGPAAGRPAGAWFDQPGTTFVTLTLGGELRGCVGGTVPHASLAQSVIDHARAAAFQDHRFQPLRAEDLPRLGVEVSVLSPLRPLAFTGPADLLSRLRPGVDGLVLAGGGRQATFLPQVWRDLPDPRDFLAALLRKGGWPAASSLEGTQGWTYTVEAWRDEPSPWPPGLAAGFLYPARHWHRQEDGRFRCEVCPHGCALREGQRGRCFVRQRTGDRLVLASYGRTSGFCVDPIEKKPFHHFLPGSSVLSFGSVGCSLSCRFCQNWHLSGSRDPDQLSEAALPEEVAKLARSLGCPSVAFTYNEPSTALEYVSDVARACHDQGVAAVAVTAGYLQGRARRDFFTHLDAANVDLKAFSDAFYRRMAGGSLQPVLDTLRYLVHETTVWTEITTLLIPGQNDSDGEIRQLAAWIAGELGEDVPLHFSAFHPAHRLMDVPPTPAATLHRARTLAREAGLRYVYTGNLRDPEGSTTYCPHCGEAVIQRDGYRVRRQALDAKGRCGGCGTPIPGRFGKSDKNEPSPPGGYFTP